MLTSLALMALFSATLHLTMQSAVALSADSCPALPISSH